MAGEPTYEELAQRVKNLEAENLAEKKALQELRLEAERIREFAKLLPVILFSMDTTSTITFVNRESIEFTGYSQEDLAKGFEATDLLVPADRERARQNIRRLFRGEDVGTSEYTAQRKDGSTFPVLLRSSPVFIDGKVVGLRGFLLDTTEQKRTEEALRKHQDALEGLVAERTTELEDTNRRLRQEIRFRKRVEEALREGEERFRTIFEGSLDAIILVDPETGEILDVNPTVSELVFMPYEEIVGLPYMKFVAPGSEDYVEELFRNVARDEALGQAREIPAQRADGSRILFEGLGQIIQIDGKPVALVVLRDITKRKRMEQELQKIQKLESLGILAGGIAHDFNNILTAISMNLSMARLYGDLREDISQMLADAEKASVRARGLTQQLLAFAKGGTPIKTTVSMATLMRDTAGFALSGSNVRCESALPDDLWLVEADQGQIGQAIQNLIINADQAMPRGGTIRIRAENVVIGEKNSLPLENGLYLRISVTDQGIGISKKDMPNIFDPFFTTKQRGSGLGLTTAFSIVNNHAGHIRVESVVEEGTTFAVYLPALGRTSGEKERTRKRYLRGEGRILLVDDEEIIWRAAGEALTRMGYEVQFAEDGAAGIELYQEAMDAERPFHAVIMDLTIPGGMGGREAVGEILEIDPDAKIIASSGYSNDPVMSSFREYGFCGIITKPYQIEKLGELLSRVTKGVQG